MCAAAVGDTARPVAVGAAERHGVVLSVLPSEFVLPARGVYCLKIMWKHSLPVASLLCSREPSFSCCNLGIFNTHLLHTIQTTLSSECLICGLRI